MGFVNDCWGLSVIPIMSSSSDNTDVIDDIMFGALLPIVGWILGMIVMYDCVCGMKGTTKGVTLILDTEALLTEV